MSGVPKTEDFEEDVDYVGEDDDEESEEDDFIPGADEEEEEEDDIVPLLDGCLFVDESQCLHYQGDGFHLSSSTPPTENVLTMSGRTIGETLEMTLTGPCDYHVESTATGINSSKATPRKMKVNFTVQSAANVDPLLQDLAERASAHNGVTGSGANDSAGTTLRRGSLQVPSNDEEDAKMPAQKMAASPKPSSALVYHVVGQQIDTHGGDALEFRGVYHIPKTKKDDAKDDTPVPLTCQVRMLPPSAAPSALTSAGTASAAVAAPAVAAAAAARIDRDDDDEEDDEGDYDEDVDYDELIALHEEAGLSVDAIMNKRYRSGESATKESPAKVAKKAPPPPADDDDEDDYGF